MPYMADDQLVDINNQGANSGGNGQSAGGKPVDLDVKSVSGDVKARKNGKNIELEIDLPDDDEGASTTQQSEQSLATPTAAPEAGATSGTGAPRQGGGPSASQANAPGAQRPASAGQPAAAPAEQPTDMFADDADKVPEKPTPSTQDFAPNSGAGAPPLLNDQADQSGAANDLAGDRSRGAFAGGNEPVNPSDDLGKGGLVQGKPGENLGGIAAADTGAGTAPPTRTPEEQENIAPSMEQDKNAQGQPTAPSTAPRRGGGKAPTDSGDFDIGKLKGDLTNTKGWWAIKRIPRVQSMVDQINSIGDKDPKKAVKVIKRLEKLMRRAEGAVALKGYFSWVWKIMAPTVETIIIPIIEAVFALIFALFVYNFPRMFSKKAQTVGQFTDKVAKFKKSVEKYATTLAQKKAAKAQNNQLNVAAGEAGAVPPPQPA